MKSFSIKLIIALAISLLVLVRFGSCIQNGNPEEPDTTVNNFMELSLYVKSNEVFSTIVIYDEKPFKTTRVLKDGSIVKELTFRETPDKFITFDST